MYVVYEHSEYIRKIKSRLDQLSHLDSYNYLCSEFNGHSSSSLRDRSTLALWILHSHLLCKAGSYEDGWFSPKYLLDTIESFLLAPQPLLRKTEYMANLYRVANLGSKSCLNAIHNCISKFLVYKNELLEHSMHKLHLDIANSLFLDGSKRSDVLFHALGNSGFFSEVETLVAALQVCRLFDMMLELDIANSIYRYSPYMLGVVHAMAQSGWLVLAGRRQQDLNHRSALRFFSLVRCLGHAEYLLGKVSMVEYKRIIYSQAVRPSLLDVLLNGSDLGDIYSQLPIVLDYMRPDQLSLAVFLRQGDKIHNENRCHSASDCLASLYRSVLTHSTEIVATASIIISDSAETAQHAASYCRGQVFQLSPTASKSLGYHHNRFLSMSHEQRINDENRIVANYAVLTMSSHISGDPASNLMNAAIASCKGTFIDASIWSTYPQIYF